MSGRLPPRDGEWINRKRSIKFSFEGKQYSGFQGDTVSSALWANGVRILGRSFKYHRPRGIFGLANTDCNAMVEDGNSTNLRADITAVQEGMRLQAVNTRGGVRYDWLSLLDFLGRVTPVGFYYKAFHTPKSLFPFYERWIREIAGLGSIRPQKRAVASPKDYAFCEVLVVGSGPSGLAAALAAAEAGADVLLVDENPKLGGTGGYQFYLDSEARDQLRDYIEKVERHKKIEVRVNSTAGGYFSDHWVALYDDHRLTKLRTKSSVIATGCYEQPAVFRNNDLPGVMLGSAAQRLIHLFAVKPFDRGVVLTANQDGYRVALDLNQAGVEVAALIDLRLREEKTGLENAVKERGIPTFTGQVIYEALPASLKRKIRGVVACSLNSNGEPDLESQQVIECDGVALSVGWTPADSLLRQAGACLEYDKRFEQFIPVDLPAGLFAAGRVNGFYEFANKLLDGQKAGLEAAAYVGYQSSKSLPRLTRESIKYSHPFPVVSHPKGKNFVDLDEDLQLKDFENAIQEGFDSPELLKRYSAVGMGPSQGKHSNLLALRILVRVQGKGMEGEQLTTARPYVNPVTLGHLAGRRFHPVQRTPCHECHEQLNAKFMYAGTWLRPEYYPVPGQNREDCIIEEAKQVRQNLGLIDLGTLGKLEISGADSVKFLEHIYTGLFTKLKVGMTRYGVMCDETGVLIDDGIVARLAEDRFYVSTTSSGAAGTYRELQRWSIRFGFDVTIVNGTQHLGAMNLAGPQSRVVLQSLTDVNLDPEEFPYLGFREGHVAGVPARLFRVGFVGELGYEIHVPADGAMRVWNALMEAGRSTDIRPFGVEAQRLLRLEKAHLIVGQDSDGLTHPFEAGMSWAVKMKKPFFVGRPSLAILQQKDLHRKLVGFLLPENHRGRVPKECHLVIDKGEIEGRVTSVAYSPSLGQTIGLAYVSPENSEPGRKIEIRMDDGATIPAIIVKIPFYDPEGSRQRVEEND